MTLTIMVIFFAIPGICFNCCIFFCSGGELEPVTFFGGISFGCTRFCVILWMSLFIFEYLAAVKVAAEENYATI